VTKLKYNVTRFTSSEFRMNTTSSQQKRSRSIDLVMAATAFVTMALVIFPGDSASGDGLLGLGSIGTKLLLSAPGLFCLGAALLMAFKARRGDRK